MEITPPPISTLENISTLKICSSLWLHKITHCHYHESDITDQLEPFELDESISLPDSVKTTLNRCLKTMAQEMYIWVLVHSYRVFVFNTSKRRHSNRNILHCLVNLVWHPNGTIDYPNTANELLQTTYLSEMEKFRMAGLYFCKDFLDRLWPAIPEDEIKDYIQPGEVFQMMLDMAIMLVSEHHLIEIHKRMENFLTWYYDDLRRIIEFKFLRLEASANTQRETIVRKLLLGLGYGVKV